MKPKLPSPWKLASSVFPILRWSRTYDLETGLGDMIAGFTVALTLIPQSIAYAALAGLEPQYGLYASFVGGFIYAVMGTCPQINIGPTALLSLLTATYTSGTNPDFAVLLCFIAGIIQLIAGVTQLGFLVDFVSLPVVSGFTSAAAITIASSQVKGLLGLFFGGETFIAIWKGLIKNIGDIRLPDTLLSLACCILLLGMKALKDIRLKSKDEKSRASLQILQKTLWFAGVARNATVVIFATVAAYCFYQDKYDPLILTGPITPGIPTPRHPVFHTVVGNTTYSASDMFYHLGTGLWVVPLVGIISNVAIAKAFSTGKRLDATQEIIALGVCNIFGAFFRSLPVNGSFSRSAVSDASGVRTPAAGLYTGVIVLLTLGLLTPYFFFIPRAALSSVIVCAVLQMVDIEMVKKLWRTNRLDLIPLIGTFLFCLGLGIEMGLMCGVGLDVLLLLYYNSRPPLHVEYIDVTGLPPHYAIHPIGGLYYTGAERVRSKLSSLRDSSPTEKPMVLDRVTIIPESDMRNGNISNGNLRNGNIGNGTVYLDRKIANTLVVYCDALHRVDYTFLESLKMLVTEWSRNGKVVWCNAGPRIKEKLIQVLNEPIFCETEELRNFLLAGQSSAITTEQLPSANNDTPL